MQTIERQADTFHAREGIDHFDLFNEMSPIEYYGLVTDGINYNNIENVAQRLETLDLPEGVLIAVAGSDGKLERHTQSKTELIVIEEAASLNGDSLLRDFLAREHCAEQFDYGPNGAIDTKVMDSLVPLSHSFGDRDALYPDRILNALPVHPVTEQGLELYFRARERALIEMSTNKRIRNELKDQLRSYKRSMKTGEFRRIPIFNVETHTQYYSEAWPAYATGFKMAHLRGTQRMLDIETLGLEGKKAWSEVAREMPTHTIGRLEYLASAGAISEEEAAAVGAAYAWYLQKYHHIQENHKEQGCPTELSYDPVAFEAYSRVIEAFVNR